MINNSNKDINLGFMFSNWYSGATLFSILLNNHSRMTCNGETFPFNQEEINLYTCSCEKPLIQCEYYRTTCSHMLDDRENCWNKNLFVVLPKISQFYLLDKWLKSFNRLFYLRDLVVSWVPAYRVKVRNFIEAQHSFFRKSCQAEQTTVYIDGTKSIRRAELFAQRQGIPFKIIHLVRDGRGFCFSYLKNEKLPRSKLTEAAQAWVEHINYVDMFSRRYPDISILTIRYEDLCNNLNMTMSRCVDFFEAGLSGDYVYDGNKDYHMLGNKMRKHFDGKVKEDLSWRKEFTPSEITTITDIMENDLIRLGYNI